MPGLAAHLVHVLHRRAYVLAGDVGPAQMFHCPAKGSEEFRRLLTARIADDHRLAAAQGQPGQRRLEGHAARQALRVGQRVVFTCVAPHAAAAHRRSQRRIVDGDHGDQSALRVPAPEDFLESGDHQRLIIDQASLLRPVA